MAALDRATGLLPHWPEPEYAAMVARPAKSTIRRCLFVAERAGALMGFAVGMIATAAEDAGAILGAELESVAVAESSRRLGVAKSLCRAVIDWAKQSGAREMHLEVRSASLGAIRLYQGLGFIAAGRRPGYYRDPEDDAILMQVEL